MIQKISAPVTVGVVFDSRVNKACPNYLLWAGRSHKIEKIGLHHTYREGRTLYHVFSVSSATLFFRLVLNSETLTWKLEEISDGIPD